MDPVACHFGPINVMSITFAAVDGTPLMPSFHEPPSLRTLPGAYITAVPASIGFGSTTVHFCVVTSRTLVGITSNEELV
jgi:hypothetical protein